jgi:hypothetical protein
MNDRDIPADQASPSIGVLERAAQSLSRLEQSPFTPGAFQALTEVINSFISDLVEESLKLARRHRSEVVSRNYVYTVSDFLIAARPRRLFRHMGTVGGILLGGSLSNILSMAQTGASFPLLGTLVSVAVGLVGTFLVAMHIAKD